MIVPSSGAQALAQRLPACLATPVELKRNRAILVSNDVLCRDLFHRRLASRGSEQLRPGQQRPAECGCLLSLIGSARPGRHPVQVTNLGKVVPEYQMRDFAGDVAVAAPSGSKRARPPGLTAEDPLDHSSAERRRPRIDYQSNAAGLDPASRSSVIRRHAPAARTPQSAGPGRAAPVPAATIDTFRAPYAGESITAAIQALRRFHGLHPDPEGLGTPCTPPSRAGPLTTPFDPGPVSRPSRQPATGPPGSYPDRTSTGRRRRA